MRTPSLRRRVTVIGVLSFAALLLVLNVALYLYLHEQLNHTVTEVIAARVDIAAELGRGRSAAELAEGLGAAGVPSIVRSADGSEHVTTPLTVRAGEAPPVSPGLPLAPRISRTVSFDDGTSVEVFATLAGVRSTLRDLLIGQTAISVLALMFAAALLRRASRVALEPLDTVVRTADRIAGGDIGERLRPDRADTELGRVAVSFDRMLDELEEAIDDAQRGEETSRRFLADAAHQLRTPVAALHASLEALLYEADPDGRDRLTGNAIRETRRLGRLLRSLLLVARFDQGETPTDEPVDLSGLVSDELERAAMLAPHLTIDLRGEGEPTLVVPGDAHAIREAVANLLDNARRHAVTTVDVSVTADHDVARIAVGDDGPGLASDQVERAFERFSSLDGRGGSGLGLPIARAIARSHGGGLRWSDGHFVLELPRSRSA